MGLYPPPPVKDIDFFQVFTVTPLELFIFLHRPPQKSTFFFSQFMVCPLEFSIYIIKGVQFFLEKVNGRAIKNSYITYLLTYYYYYNKRKKQRCKKLTHQRKYPSSVYSPLWVFNKNIMMCKHLFYLGGKIIRESLLSKFVKPHTHTPFISRL